MTSVKKVKQKMLDVMAHIQKRNHIIEPLVGSSCQWKHIGNPGRLGGQNNSS